MSHQFNSMTNNPLPPSTIDIQQMTSQGWLPNGLPPCFESESFSIYISALPQNDIDAFQKNYKFTNSAKFSIPKNRHSRRSARMIHPLAQLYLCSKIRKNWRYILANLGKTKNSLSTPALAKDKQRNAPPSKHHQIRYFETQYVHNEVSSIRLNKGFGARWVLKLDIQSCYPTLYVHNLSWTLLKKAEAKGIFRGAITSRPPEYAAATELEKAIKFSQDDETKGLPLGNDAALIISEVVLSDIDHLLFDALKNLNGYVDGFRYVDDYSLYFSDERSAETAIEIVQGLMNDYHLVLNSEKTEISRFPQPTNESWTNFFHEFRFSPFKSLKYKMQLREFFNRTVHVFRDVGDDRVSRYALQILRPFEGKNSLPNISPLFAGKDSWKSYEETLAGLLALDFRNIDVVHDSVNYYKFKHSDLTINNIFKVILGYLSDCDMSFCYEISWGLWLIELHYDEFSSDPIRTDKLGEIFKRLTSTKSQAALILISCMNQRHNILDTSDSSGLRTHIKQLLNYNFGSKLDLRSEYWMLGYVSARLGWHGLSHSDLDVFEAAMHAANVKIFDCQYVLKRHEILFGHSPRGWGGFKDYELGKRTST